MPIAKNKHDIAELNTDDSLFESTIHQICSRHPALN
jgi:hypothetical protein